MGLTEATPELAPVVQGRGFVTTTVDNLTPGTTYQFQARALGVLGFSDWSSPVNRMCI